MASQNRPCTNPSLCGVQTHRPGTTSRCQTTSGISNTATSANLTAAPPSAGPAPLPHHYSDAAPAHLRDRIPVPALTWDESKYDHGSNPLAWGAADNSKEALEAATQVEKKHGLRLVPFDPSQDENYINLSNEEREDVDKLRLALREKLGVHVLCDAYGDMGGDESDEYLVNSEGAYMSVAVGPKDADLSLWDDFGDGKTVESEGGIDPYLDTVATRFNHLWSEYTKY